MFTIELFIESEDSAILSWPALRGWMAKDNDPQTKALFDTDTLPTPFLDNVPGEEVLRVIQRLNPDKKVFLREGQ